MDCVIEYLFLGNVKIYILHDAQCDTYDSLITRSYIGFLSDIPNAFNILIVLWIPNVYFILLSRVLNVTGHQCSLFPIKNLASIVFYCIFSWF